MFVRSLIFFLFVLANMDAISCSSEVNLTKITWSHAVNSAKLLTEALGGDVDFIEADIQMGYLVNDKERRDKIPVMAHPPNIISDISLETFLQRIFNYNIENKNKTKGVKLDFKSIVAFEDSVAIIKSIYDMKTFPTWINADIIAGPVNNTQTTPVDPERFFTANGQLDAAVLSIGWTTKWGKDYLEGSYTPDHIDSMLDAIKTNGVMESGNEITFPVRAGITANSIDELSRLYESLKPTNQITFTIWSSSGDYVNVELLRKFIFKMGLDKVYVDVPEELSAQLHLDIPIA